MSTTSLSRSEITERVIALVKKLCEVDKEITPASSLLDEFDMDSLTMLRLDVAIQSDIGLALTATDIEKIVTVSDLVTALVERGQPVDAVDG
jgi:acyl carrier protein